jgi:adenylate cyclase
VRDYANHWSASPSRSLDQALEAALRAVALNDSNPYGHWALATVYVWMRRHEEAIREAERSVALDPNFAEGHIILGFALVYAGRPAEAIGCYDRGMALDPYYRDMQLHLQAQARFALGRFEEAVGFLKRRLVRNPETDISRAMLASCYGLLGRFDDARAAWDELSQVNPNYSLEYRREVLPYKNPRDFEILVEGLRKAGLVR